MGCILIRIVVHMQKKLTVVAYNHSRVPYVGRVRAIERPSMRTHSHTPEILSLAPSTCKDTPDANILQRAAYSSLPVSCEFPQYPIILPTLHLVLRSTSYHVAKYGYA